LQNGTYVRAGKDLNYLLYDGASNITNYNVSVRKAVPKLQIAAEGITFSNPNTTQIIKVPIINGKADYNVSINLNASLLSNNTANFSYTINGQTTNLNTSAINLTLSLQNLPINQNTTVTFDTSGNQNYSAVDPSVVFVPVT